MAAKANHDTDRETIVRFEQIINVGPATAEDFQKLGFEEPKELIGVDPLKLYREICRIDGEFNDPCVLDVYMATIDFMNGSPPRQWWGFTAKRKEQYSEEVSRLRSKYADRIAEK